MANQIIDEFLEEAELKEYSQTLEKEVVEGIINLHPVNLCYKPPLVKYGLEARLEINYSPFRQPLVVLFSNHGTYLEGHCLSPISAKKIIKLRNKILRLQELSSWQKIKIKLNLK